VGLNVTAPLLSGFEALGKGPGALATMGLFMILSSVVSENSKSRGESVKGDARGDNTEVMVNVRPGAAGDCRIGCCEVDEE